MARNFVLSPAFKQAHNIGHWHFESQNHQGEHEPTEKLKGRIQICCLNLIKELWIHWYVRCCHHIFCGISWHCLLAHCYISPAFLEKQDYSGFTFLRPFPGELQGHKINEENNFCCFSLLPQISLLQNSFIWKKGMEDSLCTLKHNTSLEISFGFDHS